MPRHCGIRKSSPAAASETSNEGKVEMSAPVMICSVPREKLSEIILSQYAQEEGYQVP
jgi:hypothetical protein